MTAPQKFRKKPVVIEAVRVPPLRLGDSIHRYVDRGIVLANWCGGNSYLMTNPGERAHDGSLVSGPHILIPTLEGDHAALPGDWIIRGVAGEFYPCKPEIFAATYEPAEVTP